MITTSGLRLLDGLERLFAGLDVADQLEVGVSPNSSEALAHRRVVVDGEAAGGRRHLVSA